RPAKKGGGAPSFFFLPQSPKSWALQSRLPIPNCRLELLTRIAELRADEAAAPPVIDLRTGRRQCAGAIRTAANAADTEADGRHPRNHRGDGNYAGSTDDRHDVPQFNTAKPRDVVRLRRQAAALLLDAQHTAALVDRLH